MTEYVCLLPFDFKSPTYVNINNKVIDYGMGLTIEYLFECAFNILFELQTIDDIIHHLDTTVFPEHVPNDSLSTCLSLCITTINYVLCYISQYKQYLNLIVLEVGKVEIELEIHTLKLNFNITDTGVIWNTSYLQNTRYAN